MESLFHIFDILSLKIKSIKSYYDNRNSDFDYEKIYEHMQG